MNILLTSWFSTYFEWTLVNGLDKSDVYYFQIEAFNNNGIGVKSEIKKSE